MALEPKTISIDDEQNPELRDMTRRFWLATMFTAPLAILAMGDLLPGFSSWISPRARTLLELALATPVCLWAAWPFYVRAVQSVVNRSLNMFTLIGLGVSIAYGYSIVAALWPEVFPASFRQGGEVATYFEVRVIQCREDLCLALESGKSVWIEGERFRQDLQRDVAIQFGIAGAIDLAHPTSADGCEDLVRSKPGTRGEYHRKWLEL
jgi:hypothetical protein